MNQPSFRWLFRCLMMSILCFQLSFSLSAQSFFSSFRPQPAPPSQTQPTAEAAARAEQAAQTNFLQWMKGLGIDPHCFDPLAYAFFHYSPFAPADRLYYTFSSEPTLTVPTTGLHSHETVYPFLETFLANVTLVAQTPPTATKPTKDQKIVDEVLYINGTIASRTDVQAYLQRYAEAPLKLEKHPDVAPALTATDVKVVDDILYVNNDLANRTQARQYMEQHPAVELNMEMQLEDRFSKAEETAAIYKGKKTETVAEKAKKAETTTETSETTDKYEVIDNILYVNDDIANRTQAKAYIIKNPKVRINFDMLIEDEAYIADQPTTNVVAAVQKEDYTIVKTALYHNGQLATQAEAKAYLTKNPKQKAKVNLRLQPLEADDFSTYKVGDETFEARILDEILYIEGDLATRDEAYRYLKQHPTAKFNLQMQPELSDESEDELTMNEMADEPMVDVAKLLNQQPNATFVNPEIIDGKLHFNGKVASEKQARDYQANTGISIKYDKLIGDLDVKNTKIPGKPGRQPNMMMGEADKDKTIQMPTTLTAPTGEKILLSDIYGEDIPCYSHYEGIWSNTNLFPYNFDLRNMPQRVEFFLTYGLGDDFSMPVGGNVTSEFGHRWGRHHNGMDLDLETGDGVKAVFEGKVRYAQYHASYGYLIVIRHYNGLETYYAHLSSILVHANDKIKAGQLIGLGGNTGRSYGSHLHFEVRYKRPPV